MKRLLARGIMAVACAALAVPATAFAKKYQLPDANPAVSITLPDDWNPSTTDKGVQGTSPDGTTYIAAETATAKAAGDLVTDDIAWLKDQGVVIDASTQQQMDDKVSDDMPAKIFHWTGKDKDGPTSVTLILIGVTDNLMMLVTSWATPDGEKANNAALDTIGLSIRKM